jgi:hypothetical protein
MGPVPCRSCLGQPDPESVGNRTLSLVANWTIECESGWCTCARERFKGATEPWLLVRLEQPD